MLMKMYRGRKSWAEDSLRKVHSASALPSSAILEGAILPLLRFTFRPWTLLLLLLQCLLLLFFSFPDPTSRSLISGITEASDISWAPEGGSLALGFSDRTEAKQPQPPSLSTIWHKSTQCSTLRSFTLP